MAMTETQILMCFEILNLPSGSIVYRTDNLGLNATQFAALNGPVSAGIALRATIAGLTAAQEARAIQIITEYESISLSTPGVSVESGNVGDLSSTTVSFEDRINRYRELLKIHIPFYQDWSTMETRAGEVAQMRVAVRM